MAEGGNSKKIVRMPMTEGEKFKFIERYRLHDCLWNTKISSYTNVNMRNEALADMAREFGLTIEEAKRKIASIRGTYLQERKKVENSKKTGSGSDDVYRPTLSWYYHLDFLSDVIVARKSASSERRRTEEKDLKLDEEVIDAGDVRESKKRKADELPLEEEILQHPSPIVLARADSFGAYVAAQLQEFPPDEREDLEWEINNMIHQRKQALRRKRIEAVRSRCDQKKIAEGSLQTKMPTTPSSPDKLRFSPVQSTSSSPRPYTATQIAISCKSIPPTSLHTKSSSSEDLIEKSLKMLGPHPQRSPKTGDSQRILCQPISSGIHTTTNRRIITLPPTSASRPSLLSKFLSPKTYKNNTRGSCVTLK
ncbi:uncharacterized protein LOC124155133 [Ischnura elegans]|uniref:uncharacterized protein LOC124155133 n=1 Tax=Ischnura elegans TaxID=197161 RepID=UPI001ED8B8F7|nr:uncharacterized protein LOC124155133 [Ischnura elegans]